MFLEVQSRAGVEEDAYDIITNNGPVEMRCGAGLLLDCTSKNIYSSARLR